MLARAILWVVALATAVVVFGACDPSTLVDYDGDLAGCMGVCRAQLTSCRKVGLIVLDGCVSLCVGGDYACLEGCVVEYLERDNACLDDGGICIEECIAEIEAELR